MFQRKSASSLPTTMSPLNIPTGSDSYRDGSGKAIKMDAPVVKAWKQSSSFTKYSYYILAVCMLMVFFGYRYLRYWNASIWLTCHAQECTLEVTPPGKRTMTVVFPREQLHSAQTTKVDKAGNFIAVDHSKYEPPPRGDKKSKKKGGYKSGAYKGPDDNGEYRSFMIKFHAKTPPSNNNKKSSTTGGSVEGGEAKPTTPEEEPTPDGDFEPLKSHLVVETLEDGKEVYVLHMRKFGLSQSRTRIRSSISKIESYLKQRRHKLHVKESAALPWQGLLLLIFGLLGVMLTLIIGQFWEESAPRKQGGPGVRRSIPSSAPAKNKTTPSFFVDTGRPSKYPPGYNYNKKY